MTLNVVGVVCALAAEARHLASATGAERKESREAPAARRGTTRRHEPLRSLADGTLLAVSGMGMAAAAHSARALVDAGAGALVSWGMAGGLNPALAAGTVFLPSEVVATDGTALMTAPLWRERLSEAARTQGGAGLPILLQGRLLTSPKAIGSLSDKATLFHQTGAAAVDMESLAIAAIAHSHRLPFIAIRVIVDSAGDVLPRAVIAAADSEGHLQVWRLMGALARAPANLAPLIRLAQRYRAANRSLAAMARVGSLARYVS